jgi:hypothetical protein
MRIFQGRKRAWLLALLGVVIVVAALIWRSALAKSDFEGRFDQIKIGMTIQEATALMEPERLTVERHVPEEGYSSYEYIKDEEQILLTFKSGRLTAGDFVSPTLARRFRLFWFWVFQSAPPF